MNKSDYYTIYIPFVNNQELLEECINALDHLWGRMVVIDNSKNQSLRLKNADVRVITPSVPLSLAQSWNLMTKVEPNDVFFFMHSDCIASKDAYWKLHDWVNETIDKDIKWGVIFTHYDAMAAFNRLAMKDIGGADVNLSWYWCDNDLYYRMKLNGWNKIDSGIRVEHKNGGNNTIKADLKLATSVRNTFMIYEQYYQRKWGGTSEHERFTTPFDEL